MNNPKLDEKIVMGTEEGRLAQNIMNFGRILRAAGLPIGSGQIIKATEAVAEIGITDREIFYWTLHAVYVTRIDQREIFDQALEGLPVIISDNKENKSSAIMKISSLIDTYLYISRDIDPKILLYLNETKEAVNFYYSIENSRTGIKITFAIIYIIVVTLLLFLSITIAITFAQRLTKPIVNLIKGYKIL